MAAAWWAEAKESLRSAPPEVTPAEKLAIAQAHADWSVPALWVFLGAYVVFAGMTWFFYLRKSVATGRVPNVAYASV